MADDRVALTQRIKEANDIVDVVGAYVSLRLAGPTFKGLCPFHDDHRPSFDVDPRRQRYKCWSCGKSGDVFTFIEETERISFLEARELLARRAGIPLERAIISQPGEGRALMFDLVRWAAEQFHQCLLDSPLAEAARLYLAERQLTGETIRRFGLGFALASGEWLVQKASQAGLSTELMEKLGLIAARTEGTGYYDRFRDRVMFPIRDPRGQTVGFGGRILPSSPLSARAPKYYNSAETILFSKSEQLYGIDQARQAAGKAGYVAVVEGYTDVLMAHQLGIPQVVATMGTALNVRHVQKLRGLVPRVVLVFDADAGGDTGVDRALEVFVSMEMDLRVATLPEGLDPCDLLVQRGPEPFQLALTEAVDVLEFKLNRVAGQNDLRTVEGRRQAIDAVLKILALAPQTSSVKLELMVNRIAHRFGVLKEETLWARLMEMREKRERGTGGPPRGTGGSPRGTGGSPVAGQQASRLSPREPREPREEEGTARQGPAAIHEVELLEVLLADPSLVAVASAELPARDVEHPGLRLLLEGLYRLQAEGVTPDLDQLRGRIDNQPLLAKALHLQERGSMTTDKPAYLREVLARFRDRRLALVKQELQNQLLAARDHDTAVELLRQLQNQTGG